MDLWIIYALIGMLLSGVYTFVQKIFAEKGYSVSEAIYLINFGQVFGGAVGWGLTGFSLIDWESMVLISGISGIIYIFVDLFRIRSLSYIDSAIFFPIYKAIGPALVALAGVTLFVERLSYSEIIGVILGITVPLMLLHKSEHIRQKDLRTGLLYLGISVLTSALGAVVLKYAADNDASPYLYVVNSSIVGTVTMWLYRNKISKQKLVKKVTKPNLGLSFGLKELAFGLGVMNAGAIFFLIKATEVSLSISYTINSFYILIPIILSIIFYKEHINTRKSIAIILSLLAIVFFQI